MRDEGADNVAYNIVFVLPGGCGHENSGRPTQSPWNDKERKEWRCGQPWDRREWARADSRLPRLGA
uniref:Uncharacterized protein n=1 Tax=Anguilla anguilla TaxID=7936 RepID=A0A0E9PJ94_ANGAN